MDTGSRKRPGPARRPSAEKRTDQFVCRLFRRDRLLLDLLLEIDRSQVSVTGIVLEAVRQYSKTVGIDWDNPDPALVKSHLPESLAAELLSLPVQK